MDEKIVAILLKSAEGLSASDINLPLNMDRTTLFRKLKQLSSAGIVSINGSGKFTRYRINKESEAFIRFDLSGNPALRKPVAYDHFLLDNYTPNKTKWLSGDQLNSLHSTIEEKNISNDQYRKILNFLIIDLAHSSSNIEGVDISWIDTKELIDTNIAPSGLSNFDKEVVVNHKHAIKFLIENDVALSKRDILDIHSKLMRGLFKEDNHEGAIRQRSVTLGISRYTPINIKDVLESEFNKFISKAAEIEDPFEQSFFCMVFISYLQPFYDGNRRTSRLVSNIPLIQNKMAPFSYSDIKKSDYDFGLLAFYERGYHQILANIFHNSYIKTCGYYNRMIADIESGGIISTLDGDYDTGSKSNKP